MGVRGVMAMFDDPLEYQNFLQTADADLLWTDAEEIQAMCDMFQMAATVVSVAEDDIPTIMQVSPNDDISPSLQHHPD